MYSVKFVHAEEIRRISVDTAVSLGELKQLAQSIFQNTLPKDFVFQYRDDEGDNVTICTDRELSEAFRLFHSGAIIRFAVVPRKIHSVDYVEEKVVEQKPEEKKEATIEEKKPEPATSVKDPFDALIERRRMRAHRALCDACNIRIRGIRWKCVECADFDLCDSCHSKNLHNHHQFSKIEFQLKRFRRPRVRFVDAPKEPTVEEPKKEEPTPVEEKKPEPVEVKKEEVKKEEPKPEEVKKEEPKKEEVKKEEPKVEEKKVEPVEVKKEEPKIEQHPFESKLKQLDEMGFSDRVKNISLLVKHNGDMLAVVRDLLE